MQQRANSGENGSALSPGNSGAKSRLLHPCRSTSLERAELHATVLPGDSGWAGSRQDQFHHLPLFLLSQGSAVLIPLATGLRPQPRSGVGWR